MKLGLTYSLFSGEELLPFSILAIRQHVDYVNVVFQEYSWFGDKCTPLVRPLLNDLKNKNLIDKAIEYPFKDFGNTKQMAWYVIDKKNRGLEDLKKNGCTHCMIMDCDEFYFADQFFKAKQFVAHNGITHSACSIYWYRYLPELRLRDVSILAVPFIFELRADSQLTPFHNLPCYVDDLRTLLFMPNKDKFYYFNSLCMHHMSEIRFDFGKKTRAAFNNVTIQGRTAMSNALKNHTVEANLPKEELLAMKSESGGYVDVGDPFNLNESLKLLRESAAPLFNHIDVDGGGAVKVIVFFLQQIKRLPLLSRGGRLFFLY